MRVLIVGAGIAGLTLAALLKQREIPCEIIERQANLSNAGYMLGIYPLGSKVLYGLGLMRDFIEGTVPADNYIMANGENEIIQQLPFSELFTAYGPYRCCSRKALIQVLLKGCEGIPIRFNSTLESLSSYEDKVSVTFNDGSKGEYDLLVGADGMHSSVRRLAFNKNDYDYYDTGWGGWVWWSDDPMLNKNMIREFWGEGTFFGIYPTENKFGVIAVTPTMPEKVKAYSGRANDIKKQFPELAKIYPTLFSQIPKDDDEHFFYWPLSDVRTKRWYSGRVALVGDAAVGFLPTAGIGASMAMESAAVLADELSRTDQNYLGWALSLYQKSRQQRVEKTQKDSRQLAKFMFVKSTVWANLRNWLLQYYSIKNLAKSIDKSFQEPI
ncbi:FAD-dependent oxidoreductase [Legionella jordanis]|uniref:Oxidoreductase n=1 Tax=Legionella jordanis TaxID=456 RepID=A0A0W0VBP1_9GAMM|nr:NAD(P)/FAD-dependent oxidoreductase [Legionella jordanis]KTD17049.1 oxidoreductase [Legionella jordanis]RMX03185.1 FAD-dependent monooxygenase [Legionella jordanis]VEH12754.1 oxidoreductase [Legionella jordanis]